MQEALRTYMELAMGLTDVSRKRVKKVVKEAVGRGGATADQVKALTTELMAANSANREALSKIVRFEVDRALGVVGLATADEVGELTARVRDLEKQLRAAETRADGVSAPGESANGAAPAPTRATTAAPTKATKKAPTKATKAATKRATKAASQTTTATKAAAKKTVAKKAPAKRTATKAVTRRSPATTAAKKTTAKKTTAKRTVAKKAAAKKTVGAQS
jgi:polyhydroxyalkanoate synthesis regulator phasin